MRNIILVALTIGAFWFGAEKAFAQCKCSALRTTATEFKSSDAVFVGKVVKVVETAKKTGGDSEVFESVVKFEVTQAWKRDLKRFVLVKMSYQSTKGFEENEEWLLYARKTDDGMFSVSVQCCTGTKLLSVVGKDLKTFEEMGEKPKNIIERR